MPTSSFDKSVVITEEDAIERLVNSLLYDKPRVIENKYLTPESEERGKRILKDFMEKERQRKESEEMEIRQKITKGIEDELTIELGDKLLMDYPKISELIRSTTIYQALLETNLKEDMDIYPAAALILGELRETHRINTISAEELCDL